MAVRLLARLLSATRDLLGEQVVGWYGVGRREARLAWERRPRAARAVAAATGVALCAAGLVAFAAQRAAQADQPSPLDWRAAGALLARDRRPGDAVVLSPAWLERAREVLPADLPVVPAPEAAEPLPGVRRVWLLSAPGLPRRARTAAAEVDLLRRAPRAEPQRLGGLEVTRLDLAEPERALADLAALAPDLVALREAGGQPRRCLVLRPPPGQPLVRELAAAPLGGAIAGHATVLAAPSLPDGGPLRLAFQVDGEEVGALELRTDQGRRAFHLDTARHQPGPHRLTVVVTGAAAQPAALCLEARTLP